MKRAVNGPLHRLLDLGSSMKNDGWFNVLTGLGVRGKDKRIGAQVLWLPFTETDCENLYGHDDVAAKVVDIVPEQAFREGYEIKVPEEAGGVDTQKKIMEEIERLDVDSKFEETWKWARCYGGGAIFIDADDSTDLAKPLNPAAIQTIKNLVVFNRFELNYMKIDSNIHSKNFGFPESYMISSSHGANTQEIHYSRFIRFDGVKLPTRLFIQNNYWGDSILNRLLNALRNFNLAQDSAASTLQDFRQGILKLNNLADMLASGDDALVKQRIEIMNLSKSVLNAVVLDAENEDYTYISNQLSGADGLLDRVTQRLVIATGMPHTVVLGDSPSGLGASGESEKKDFYDQISSLQESILRPRLVRMFDLILAQKVGPTGGKPIPNLTFDFRPLWQMSSKEDAEVKKLTAETDQIYIQNGVVDPSEVAISRFGGDTYSTETSIDTALREKPTEEPQPIETPAPLPAPTDSTKNDKIMKEGDLYLVTNETGTKILGQYKTYEEAQKQLAAIEANKKKT